MMGRRHAISGVMCATVTAPAMLAAPGPSLSLGAWAAGWVAGAMAPDFDSGGSHPARVWGGGSRVAGAVVGWLAGGHRESTHDIVLAPVVAGAVLSGLLVGSWWAAGAGSWLAVVGWLLLALPFGFALRMLAVSGVHPRLRVFASGPVNLAGSLVLAGMLMGDPGRFWFPVAFALGMVAHILGDSVTSEGAPVSLVWVLGEKALGVDNEKTRKDWRRRQWGFRLFRVGSPQEEAMGPVMVAVTVLAVVAYSAAAVKFGMVAPPGLPSGPGLPDAPDGPRIPDVWEHLAGLGEFVLARLEEAAHRVAL